MDFQSLNRFNVLVNTLSGCFLPVTSKRTKLAVVPTIYLILVWLLETTYLVACVLGLSRAPKERVLKDGTVNIVISLEGIVLLLYLQCRRNRLRELIEKLNRVLSADNELLRDVTVNTVKPLERPLKIYTVASVSSLALWTSLPFFEVFQKNEFRHTDYQVPAVVWREPFSSRVFVAGVVLQVFGSVFTMIRKISLDLYTMHLILLTTAQYKYLRIEFATILRRGDEEGFKRTDVARRDTSYEDGNTIEGEMKALIRHYETVIELAIMLRKILSPNIGILYVNNVFRFCFLSFMFVTSSTMYFEKFLIISYTVGALTQFYILCFCIQELLEASTTITDDAVHEKWYVYNVSLQRLMSMIILGNKLECKLSSLRSIDLTLPYFMSILNQAYSVCLLFLKAR